MFSIRCKFHADSRQMTSREQPPQLQVGYALSQPQPATPTTTPTTTSTTYSRPLTDMRALMTSAGASALAGDDSIVSLLERMQSHERRVADALRDSPAAGASSHDVEPLVVPTVDYVKKLVTSSRPHLTDVKAASDAGVGDRFRLFEDNDESRDVVTSAEEAEEDAAREQGAILTECESERVRPTFRRGDSLPQLASEKLNASAPAAHAPFNTDDVANPLVTALRDYVTKLGSSLNGSDVNDAKSKHNDDDFTSNASEVMPESEAVRDAMKMWDNLVADGGNDAHSHRAPPQQVGEADVTQSARADESCASDSHPLLAVIGKLNELSRSVKRAERLSAVASDLTDISLDVNCERDMRRYVSASSDPSIDLTSRASSELTLSGSSAAVLAQLLQTADTKVRQHNISNDTDDNLCSNNSLTLTPVPSIQDDASLFLTSSPKTSKTKDEKTRSKHSYNSSNNSSAQNSARSTKGGSTKYPSSKLTSSTGARPPKVNSGRAQKRGTTGGGGGNWFGYTSQPRKAPPQNTTTAKKTNITSKRTPTTQQNPQQRLSCDVTASSPNVSTAIAHYAGSESDLDQSDASVSGHRRGA